LGFFFFFFFFFPNSEMADGSPALPTVIHVSSLAGSPYVARALLALEIAGVEESGVKVFVENLHALKLSKQLPSVKSEGELPSTVPRMVLLGEDTSAPRRVAVDSDDSVAIVAQLWPAAVPALYPNDQARETEALMLKEMWPAIYYCNWVDDDGFERHIAPVVRAAIPKFVQCIVTPQALLKKKRESAREKTKAAGVEDLDAARKCIGENLAKLEAQLVAHGGKAAGAYLAGAAYSMADATAFAMISHLIDYCGDAQLSPSLPDAWALGGECPALEDWFQRCKRDHPLRYTDRVPPKDVAKRARAGEGVRVGASAVAPEEAAGSEDNKGKEGEDKKEGEDNKGKEGEDTKGKEGEDKKAKEGEDTKVAEADDGKVDKPKEEPEPEAKPEEESETKPEDDDKAEGDKAEVEADKVENDAKDEPAKEE
jgi:glutathione S-transferase